MQVSCHQVYSVDTSDSTPQEKMEKLWGLIRADYREHKVDTQMTNITLKSFCDPAHHLEEFPVLSAKAAETKDLAPSLLRIWNRCRDGRDAEHRKVTQMLQHLVELQKILSTHAHLPILPERVAAAFKTRVNDFLMVYSQLANAADGEGALLFATAPKHHYMAHMADRAQFVNPRKSCCLIDESFVGQMKAVVRANAHGTQSHTIQQKVAEVYRYGFMVSLRNGPFDVHE